jgi:hypothetical protein
VLIRRGILHWIDATVDLGDLLVEMTSEPVHESLDDRLACVATLHQRKKEWKRFAIAAIDDLD